MGQLWGIGRGNAKKSDWFGSKNVVKSVSRAFLRQEWRLLPPTVVQASDQRLSGLLLTQGCRLWLRATACRNEKEH
jgi:hypothetical protein